MAKPTCHSCVYAYWDRALWMRTLMSGFPSRPFCANHPDSFGREREVPYGDVCRNYRPRPATPDLADGTVKRIPIAGGFIAYVDAADYEWLNQWTWGMHDGYVARIEKGKRIYMHRQIMNPPGGMVVDHLNANRMDNTRANLHICSPAENNRNQTKRRGSSSRYLGVYFNHEKQKWHTRIGVNGKQESIGRFDDEVEAARAYDRAAVMYFGESARLNFPDEWPPAKRRRVRLAATKSEGRKAGGRKGKTTPARPRATRRETTRCKRKDSTKIINPKGTRGRTAPKRKGQRNRR